ncbi:MAG TPA: hypothetical protein PKY77_15220 [Phycisphaerae bacterium]|nr:hypothetical protein [Phycisphaerae bacterium]HRY68335.1 hypothetical protein [Phycisphaerae bacterium]HSA26782.1 hypothetical protein [Phycisphaerae bacterium]
MSRTPGRSSSIRKGLTRVEIVAFFVFTVIVLALIPPITLQRSGRLAPLAVCAANLKELGRGMHSYAGENAGAWPIAAHAPATENGKCTVTYAPGKIGTHRGHPQDPKAGETQITDTEMSVTRSLWTLVRQGMSSPPSFVCPLTSDHPGTDENPQGLWDFARYSEISYGLQVPYGTHGRPATTRDPRMALAADKGPFGAALEAGARQPGPVKAGTAAAPGDWMPWNSPNHGGKNQTVLYADGHIESQTTPVAGYMNDNIYTRWSNATGGLGGDERIRVQGTPPAGTEAPFGNTDTLIYP